MAVVEPVDWRKFDCWISFRPPIPEILSELAPFLGKNLIQHIAVLIAIAVVGVPVFAAIHRLLPPESNESEVYRRRMRDVIQIGLLIFVFLVLAAMGYVLFNLLAGRYSSNEGASTTAYRSPTEYKLLHQPRDLKPR